MPSSTRSAANPAPRDRLGLPTASALVIGSIIGKTLAATGNPDVRFVHCLPALRDHDTRLGGEVLRNYGLDALEVTDEVFSSPASIVFDQADNRLHTIKAVLLATLED